MRWRAQSSRQPGWYATSRAQQWGLSLAETEAILAAVELRYLGQGAKPRERKQFRQRLHLDELFLARACARGHEAAWEQLWQRYRPSLQAAARALTREAAQAAELADSLFAELYGLRERNGERVSKLNSYTGIGSLQGWMCALLAQARVDQWRRERRLVALDEQEQLVKQLAAPPPGGGDAGQDATAPRLQLEAALESVLQNIESPARLLLSLYFLDGWTLAQIGSLLHVHESTVSRRLERLLTQLRRQTRRQLERSGMPARASAEAMHLDPRWLEVDVRKWLQPAAPTRNHGGSPSV